MSAEEFATQLSRDNGLPEEAIAVVAKKLEAQIARLEGVWDAKWNQIAQGAGPDMRVLKIEADLGELVLRDCLEWNVNDLQGSPEEFAQMLAVDLALKREHETQIAHAIRVQLFAAWEASLKGEPTAWEAGQVIRNNVEPWTPTLLAKAEVKKQEEEERQRKLQDRRERAARGEVVEEDDEDDDDEEDDEEDEDDQDDEEDDGNDGNVGNGNQEVVAMDLGD